MSLAVEMKNINKWFGSHHVCKNVSLSVEKGEIHALLGENGAGKTTLMNILFGLYSSDSGTISINGKKCNITSPTDALHCGIGMVHQHFMLIPQLTVTDNLLLSSGKKHGLLNRKKCNRDVQELIEKYHYNLSATSYIKNLSVGLQQKVEILKVLQRDTSIIVFDEPTAVLTPDEVDELFTSLELLKNNGHTIILITHKMREVMTYCDRVTVMRSGEIAGSVRVKETTSEELVELMVGKQVSLERRPYAQGVGHCLMEVRDLSAKSAKNSIAFQNITFQLHEREILGIAGVDGNGQFELGETIVGVRKALTGELSINGRTISLNRPQDNLKNKLACIFDDRQKKGLILPFSIEQNFILGLQDSPPFTQNFFIHKRQIEDYAKELCAQYDVRPNDPSLPVQTLSGGNQQKVIIGRELSKDYSLLIAMQPTRGLDIGAIEFVHDSLRKARESGHGVLLISTDLDEILALSDRILVMFNGRIVGETTPDDSLQHIGALMAGLSS